MNKQKLTTSILQRLKNVELENENLTKHKILIESLADISFKIGATLTYETPLVIQSLIVWTVLEYNTNLNHKDQSYPPEAAIIKFTKEILEMEGQTKRQNKLRNWYKNIASRVRFWA